MRLEFPLFVVLLIGLLGCGAASKGEASSDVGQGGDGKQPAVCLDIPVKGCCSGRYLVWCNSGTPREVDCGTPLSCGWNSTIGEYDCGTDGQPDPSGVFPLECPGVFPPAEDTSPEIEDIIPPVDIVSTDVTNDAGSDSCVTACSGKDCGQFRDCSCGVCDEGWLCLAHVCLAENDPCIVACEDKICGTFEGCVCGYCEDGICDASGTTCTECEPVCANEDGSPFECGNDGCGGNCGNCADALDCTEEVCISGFCEVGSIQEDSCLVDGLCIEAGVLEPLNPCAACSPTENQLGWSPLPEGAPCGPSLACSDGLCVHLCTLSALAGTSAGCAFWAVDLDNAFMPGGRTGFYDAAGQQYALVVSNPSFTVSAEVQIEGIEGPITLASDDTPLPTTPIPPGGIQTYLLPRRDVDGTVRAPLAYRLTSSVPVSVVQYNPLETVDVFSNDASLLLPSTAAGLSYVVMTQEQSFSELRSFLAVVPVAEGVTTVTVTVTAPTEVGTDQVTGASIGDLAPGESFTISLQPFDVLNIETDAIGADLTGSTVTASQPVIVFSGSEAANAPSSHHCLSVSLGGPGVCEWDGSTPCSGNEDCIAAGFATCCADHLEEQLLPVPYLGTHYPVARTWPRNEAGDVFRILAVTDNTLVTTQPVQVNIPILNQGEWIEFTSSNDFEIIATAPVMVGQFLAGEQAPDPNVGGVPGVGDAGIGDPSFILGIPSARFGNAWGVAVMDIYEYNYISIVAPAGTTVWLDCEATNAVEAETLCVPLPPSSLVPFGTGAFAATRFPVDGGFHRVLSDAPVGVYSYGWSQYVSYGHPAGFNHLVPTPQ